MANREQSKILKQGAKAWNAWREKHKTKRISLYGADLGSADLRGADLRDAHLMRAYLSGADLRTANLDSADLTNANLTAANLSSANLRDANLNGADFRFAKLARANVSGANLSFAIFTSANLSGANLSGTDLAFADLTGATLTKTDLSRAKIAQTTFGQVKLNEAVGLDTVIHQGPSTVGIDTLYNSHGEIPDKFLLDACVPEEIIDIARSIRAGPAIQWHSCFISHSTKDEDFARRLHLRMRAANMRVWFAPENLKGGIKLHEQLFQAIQIYDRVLIVLSEHSIQSDWVMTEIRKAREVEKKEKCRKLFPIRLCDMTTLQKWECFDADTGKDLAVEVREYFIPNFSNWKSHDAFESAFARLRKDLEAENSRK